jgi:hypothetical protein
MLPNPHTAHVAINYLTSPTPVVGWGTSFGLTGNTRCSSDEQDLGMTPVSIPHITNGTREKKRNDAVDHPFFVFFSFFFSFFFPLLPSFPWPITHHPLQTIKGEAGRPMQGIAREAGYDPFQAQKHSQPTGTWELIPLSTVCNPYYKLKCK